MGKYMGLFEYSMDFLAIMECLWLYMSYVWGSYGYLWVFMGMYGYLWVFMGKFGYIWVHRVCMGIYGLNLWQKYLWQRILGDYIAILVL